MPTVLRRGLTCDRGLEMACHSELARRQKIDIWCCDPPAPWQRGSSENTNGLLRQFSQRDLDRIARLLNHRPRKTLAWKTPAEAFVEEIRNISPTVAGGT